jgi:DNA-binding LacI/PurR family transcriptional regulator
MFQLRAYKSGEAGTTSGAESAQLYLGSRQSSSSSGAVSSLGQDWGKLSKTNGRVNMHDIAERAKVSIGTVSNVINGTVPVRASSRGRVLDAIQALGYQRSQLARGLRRDYTNMIGMIIPDITNPFFPAMVRAAEDVAYAHGYRLVLCNSDNDPKKEASYLTELQSYLPAGLLLIPAVDSEVREQPMRNGRPTPTVCIDRKPCSLCRALAKCVGPPITAMRRCP